jgi:2-polyprenyl-3-methyl-5-hydroxy-6-metoxy-1,4-benzoquinol methylase
VNFIFLACGSSSAKFAIIDAAAGSASFEARSAPSLYPAAERLTWFSTELGRAVHEVESRLVEAMFVPPGPEVLEVGCGTGLYTARLVRRGYRVTGLDASGQMLARARERLVRLGMSANWIQGSVEEAAGRLGTYDGILSVTAFEFIPDPDRVVRTVFEHLRPGGCLVVAVIAEGSAWSAHHAAVARERPDSVFARARFWRPEEVARWDVGVACEMGTALHFPPTVSSYEDAMTAEQRRCGLPGFLVAKWVKP